MLSRRPPLETSVAFCVTCGQENPRFALNALGNRCDECTDCATDSARALLEADREQAALQL